MHRQESLGVRKQRNHEKNRHHKRGILQNIVGKGPSRAMAEPLRKKQLQGRLQHLSILELRKDGQREILHLTLRGLYDYVLSCITNRTTRLNERVKQYSSGLGKDTLHPVSETNEDTQVPYIPSTQSPKITVKTPLINETARSYQQASPTMPPLQLDADLLSPQNQTTPFHAINTKTFSPHTEEGTDTFVSAGLTLRERLGGYLHPRDMRRLVTPFISSNEPALMVRRHVMLLNFDPLRTIVLRDRLLVLVPDGADSILFDLERRVRGTMHDVTAHVFEDIIVQPELLAKGKEDTTEETSTWNEEETEHTENIPSTMDKKMMQKHVEDPLTLSFMDEWDNINARHFIDLAFELQAVDAVLATVCAMLSEETRVLKDQMIGINDELRGDSSASPADNLQEQLRALKDSVQEMEGRVQGVVRALNLILDDDEDMALMNLSRLISHPERYLQPVSQDILNEESDEPELILEAYLQQVLCESNVLELLKGNISSTEGLVTVKLDAIRNRLLYINTMIAIFTLSVTVETVVGSFFGTNLDNHLMESTTAWWNVTLWTALISAFIVAIFTWVLYRLGVTPSIRGEGYFPK